MSVRLRASQSLGDTVVENAARREGCELFLLILQKNAVDVDDDVC